ncbi:phosphopantetheine-binding protein (plasmid) [Pseudarthrobacter sp. O4]|uniref:phosphopantetheine-binding protein n=1 Tax=Pseudarthrobacter sp. O4 TaxID=3418417 RepID=UPI003CF4F121
MSKPAAHVTAEDLLEMVHAAAPEIIGEATVQTNFDQMEVDSLSLVEIAVMISEKYGLVVHDWEIAQAGSFAELAQHVNGRRVLEGAF